MSEIDVIFTDGRKVRYAAENANVVRRVFRQSIKKIIPVQNAESEKQEQQDIAVLREAAKQLGVKGHHNLSPEKLKAAVDKALKG